MRIGGALAPLLCAALVGCATPASRGDRLFERGDYVRAEAAYRAQLGGRGARQAEARALFRLTLLHALEGGALFNPQRAARYLSLLEERHPGSGYAAQASRLVGLAAEATRLRAEVAALGERTDLLLGALARLQEEEAGFQRERREHDETRRDLAVRIARLEAEIESLRADLAAREDELERLKKIDLEVPR